MQRPVTIAGGGLAGLSLGVALRLRGVETTIHEASTYPRHRVCGEFISGVTESTLANLGIARCFDGAEHLTSAAWHDRRGRIAELEVPGLGIPRRTLDDRLRLLFTSLGGRLATRSRIAPAPGVIWAAGRPRTRSRLLGLKCHLTNLTPTHDLEMFASPSGYIGLAKVGDGITNVCGLFTHAPCVAPKGPARLAATVRAAGLPKLADRLEAAEPDPSSFLGVASFTPGRQPGPPFSIGDASSMIPPFTGNGMTMAFESAECALEPALAYAEGRLDWTAAARAARISQSRRFRRRMAAGIVLHHVLTSRTGLGITASLARRGMLPLTPLLQLVR
jgi:menaquinone-9 beta-reductase